jgi:hypothetical protein
MDSILQTEKECFICGTTQNLHRHHVFYGNANRSLSEKDGCVVYLCMNHHTGAAGVHGNQKINISLKKKMQKRWMEYYGKSKEDFIKRYGKNYL